MTLHAGIPYATASRWGAPSPVVGGVPAATFGPSAPQRRDGPLVEAVPGMRVGATDEDCLTLNVWAPAGADGLPVMVWIHGGAYVIGGSSLPTYDGARLSERGEVVVVSLNYRLGALANLLVGASTNRGLLDQVAGLRWVRDHIGGFGGDPANVTVFGESAGAGGILHLLGAPVADGLFRRIILQSPGAEVVRRPAAEALAAAFDAPLDSPVDAVLDAQDAAVRQVTHRFGSMPWAPVVDGEIVPAPPADRVAAGAQAGVDALVGTTSAELALFTRELAPAVVPKVLRRLWAPVLGRDPGAEACARLVAAYEGDATQVLGDAVMGVPALRLTDAFAAHNPRTFAYRFDWDGGRFGPCHAADLPFTFGTFEVDGWESFVGADADARRLSDDMIRSWSNFAHSGDPGWPAHEPAARPTMVFGRTSTVTEHPLATRLRFHEEVS